MMTQPTLPPPCLLPPRGLPQILDAEIAAQTLNPKPQTPSPFGESQLKSICAISEFTRSAQERLSERGSVRQEFLRASRVPSDFL
jgi:hypothetical protein